MAQPKPARPSQVTLAGWLVVVGSVVVVLMAFGQVAGLRSLETREAIEDYLSKPPGDSLGLTVSSVRSVLQVALMVAAATAAATAILGWQVLQRSKGARVALSVLAAPLFVTGLAGGGVAAAVVSAAIVMLWFQPARDWFDGVSRAAPSPPSAAPRVAPDGRDPLLDLPPPTGPPLHAGYATEPSAASGAAARRPTTVTWACLLTWLCSLTTFAVLGLTTVTLLADPGIIDDARRQSSSLEESELTDTVLRNAVLATSGAAMLWSAVAVVLALLAWRRVRWAATALLVSAAVAGALCLLTLIGSLVMLVPLAACAGTVALLARPESRAWLRGAARQRRSGSVRR
jgi:hypothetical protein